MRRKVFGNDHASVSNTLCNLADVLYVQGKLPEAEVMYREAVATQRKLLGTENPNLPDGLNGLAKVLQGQGKLAEAKAVYHEALAAYRMAADSTQNNSGELNELAWTLATCPFERLRDPADAVELAARAVELAPQTGRRWNTLGVARYRAGEWQSAIEALGKSMELSKGGNKGGNASDWFFLAMAHWQLGHNDEARTSYDKAVEWMDKNQPKNEELLRFRAEAAELLGIGEPQPPPDKQPADDQSPNTNNPTPDSAPNAKP